ncbi:MAG: hypothetical protein D3922_15200, partial [Candidatus Electrothrix sp. AR1]|nr:hypothetical protein [Candidatus Electrothrix sp. AR1]
MKKLLWLYFFLFAGMFFCFGGIAQADIEPEMVEKLLADDGAANDDFGLSVSVSGDTSVIGALGDDDNGSSSGSAYVFTRTYTGWTQAAKLTPDDGAAYDSFGSSVSVSGDIAVIGAFGDGDNGSSSGSAYVFTRTDTGWTQAAKLTPDDGAADDYFGSSVSVSGDIAVIGAPNANEYPGSAYV